MISLSLFQLDPVQIWYISIFAYCMFVGLKSQCGFFGKANADKKNNKLFKVNTLA